jgi:hypothetical protein
MRRTSNEEPTNTFDHWFFITNWGEKENPTWMDPFYIFLNHRLAPFSHSPVEPLLAAHVLYSAFTCALILRAAPYTSLLQNSTSPHGLQQPMHASPRSCMCSKANMVQCCFDDVGIMTPKREYELGNLKLLL